MSSTPRDIGEVMELLSGHDYISSRALATSVFLALRMGKPLLLEGEAGVGKTEVARTLAAIRGRELIRLQCYEGLDVSSAAYEWDYSRQMMEIRIAEVEGRTDGIAAKLYSRDYLLRRPLLEALDCGGSGVLLIDEIDRADEPFEAFLLEFLSDFQLSIPELGTVRAKAPPVAIITSNRTREIHDALKRRCLYHWVDYPSVDQEREILCRRAPAAVEGLRNQLVGFVHELRNLDLYKIPGVAETIDWANALVSLNRGSLDAQTVDDTLGALLKYQDDVEKVKGKEVVRLLDMIAGDD